MSQENRRTSYRTLRAESRLGILRYGRRRIPVRVLNESAGGFCVSSEESCDLVSEAEAELLLDDGYSLGVKVKYVDLSDLMFRIGLERVDHGAGGARAARSRAFRPASSIGALTVAASTFLGYVIGTNLPLAWLSRPGKSEPAIHRASHEPRTAP